MNADAKTAQGHGLFSEGIVRLHAECITPSAAKQDAIGRMA